MPSSPIRRAWVFIAGITVIVVGIILSIPGVPGPGFVVITMGVAILATEFPWARRMMVRGKEWVRRYMPTFISKHVHISEDDAKMMSDHRNKRHAPAAD